MRTLLLAVFLAIFACAVFAQQPFPYGKFVPANMGYTATNFTHQNSTYQAIVVQEQVYAILSPSSGAYQFEPMQELEGIKAALYSYYLSQGYSPNAVQDLAKAHALIGMIEGSRKKGEAKCRTLLGTDRNTCDTFEHCLQACYSVTSFCQPVALGAGRPFVEAMWMFENDTLLLDKAYRHEREVFDNVSANATYENLNEYMRSIEQINRQATKASSSPLYDWYSYCFSPDYSMPSLTNIQLMAQKSFAKFSPFFGIGATAQNVMNLTYYGIKKKEYIERQELALLQENATNATNAEMSTKESELLGKYNSLNVSQAVFSLGPYNQSEFHKAEPPNASKLVASDQHLNIETLILASVVSLVAVGLMVFLFFKLREDRDRL